MTIKVSCRNNPEVGISLWKGRGYQQVRVPMSYLSKVLFTLEYMARRILKQVRFFPLPSNVFVLPQFFFFFCCESSWLLFHPKYIYDIGD